jgi:DNA-binding CsgD family transcriptional regulator
VHNLITDFIDRIDSFHTLDDLRTEMGRRLTDIGFNRFAYLVVRAPEGPAVPFVITTYPDEWGVVYGQKDYVNFDPVVIKATQSLLPFDWISVRDRQRGDRQRLEVFNAATEFGIDNGITVPIHGPAGSMASFSVTADLREKEFAALWRAHRHELHLIALYYHAAFEKRAKSSALPKVLLTARERECLLWACRGKTAIETSEILGISRDTVIFHLRNVMQKIGVYSKQHAVVKAILMGLIHP